MLLIKALCLGLVTLFASSSSQEFPKVYEYFTEDGITSGLVAGNKEFRLNGKYVRLISGAVHYFRVHPAQWRDRLRKLRAMGANAVETYVSWNLHEPRKDEFDFGNGDNDFSEFMNIRRFIEMAQEEDLLVILRPGPYVCAEWDWGGFPSWLARDPNMKVRENYQPFLDRVKVFFDNFLPQIVDLQFTRGGSIIAVQIENEYASFSPRSLEYLQFIQQCLIDNQFNESLFFTADNSGWIEMSGAIPGVLQTINTHQPDGSFPQAMEIQPDMPLMAMEYYTGWMTHWTDEKKGSRDTQDYIDNLEKIFGKYNGSVNFYMYFGGTNFAFMSGANSLGEPPYLTFDTTSYDYDALISEAGDYHLRYNLTADLIAQYENPKIWKPERPAESVKTIYPKLDIQEFLTYADIIDQIPSSQKVTLEKPVSMENLPINNDNGQSFGYVIYRKTANFTGSDIYKVSWPRDLAQLIIDGKQVDTGFLKQEPEYWINSIKEFPLTLSIDQPHTIDLMVENMGRINFGASHDFVQHKGIASIHQAKIELNNEEISGVEIIAAEFNTSWVKSLSNWRSNELLPTEVPCIFRTTLTIPDEPTDTFIDMTSWHKGIVIINGFNIGRYWRAGPQYTLYIPAPLLHTGENEIIVFEQLEAGSQITFTDTPMLG